MFAVKEYAKGDKMDVTLPVILIHNVDISQMCFLIIADFVSMWSIVKGAALSYYFRHFSHHMCRRICNVLMDLQTMYIRGIYCINERIKPTNSTYIPV